MESCDAYAALISAAVDGEAAPEERGELMEHLARCPACREAYRQTLGLHEAFGALEADPPDGLADAVMAAIRAERPVRRGVRWRPIAAVAACFALVLLGYQGLRGGVSDNSATGGGAPPSAAMDASTAEAGPDAAPEEARAGGGIPAYQADEKETAPTQSAPDAGSGDAGVPADQEVLQNALTYFRSVPEAEADPGVPEAEADADGGEGPALLTVNFIHSGDPALAERVELVSGAEEYSETGASVWVVTAEELESLEAHLIEERIAYERDRWETEGEAGELFCVIYLAGEAPP